MRFSLKGAAFLAAVVLGAGAAQAQDKSLAQQIFEAMAQDPGAKPGYRVAHAKGIVCEGTFVPSAGAAKLSKAAHFRAGSVPVTVRFSDGSADPFVPDNSHNAGPRGMAVRFTLPGGGLTDIEGQAHNGFAVGTGEEFLALVKAAAATDPSRPHPWPIETFLGAHPRALKFVQGTAVIPASFGTAAYFSNNAFVFVNKDGVKQAGRYQFLPAAGRRDLSDAEDALLASEGDNIRVAYDWLASTTALVTKSSMPLSGWNSVKWCRGPDLNRRHLDFQSSALPS